MRPKLIKEREILRKTLWLKFITRHNQKIYKKINKPSLLIRYGITKNFTDSLLIYNRLIIQKKFNKNFYAIKKKRLARILTKKLNKLIKINKLKVKKKIMKKFIKRKKNRRRWESHRKLNWKIYRVKKNYLYKYKKIYRKMWWFKHLNYLFFEKISGNILTKHPRYFFNSRKRLKKFSNKWRFRWKLRKSGLQKLKYTFKRVNYLRRRKRNIFFKNRTFFATKIKWVPRKNIVLHPTISLQINKLITLGLHSGLKKKNFSFYELTQKILQKKSSLQHQFNKYFFMFKRKRSNYYFTVINKQGEVVTNYSSGRMLTFQKKRRNRKARNAVFNFIPVMRRISLVLKKKKIFNIEAFIKPPSLKYYHVKKISRWLTAHRIQVNKVLFISKRSHGLPTKNKKVRRL